MRYQRYIHWVRFGRILPPKLRGLGQVGSDFGDIFWSGCVKAMQDAQLVLFHEVRLSEERQRLVPAKVFHYHRGSKARPGGGVLPEMPVRLRVIDNKHQLDDVRVRPHLRLVLWHRNRQYDIYRACSVARFGFCIGLYLPHDNNARQLIYTFRAY